ncbi:hypothetical protein JL722_12094 [Aureococcus anophagefferens]|nr:hypothetical protein JL722_12094 [Aureococcus anophagefferens]
MSVEAKMPRGCPWRSAMRALVVALVAHACRAQRCRTPPDGAAFARAARWSLQNGTSCFGVAPRDLWACEEAVQRALDPTNLPPEDGCAVAGPKTTALRTGSRDTVPNAQTWSSLRWASYEGRAFVVHDPAAALFRSAVCDAPGACRDGAPPRILGASKWGLFWHDGADATAAAATAEPYERRRCDRAFGERTYVLNILTWQDERAVLGDNIARTVYGETPYALLRRFTAHPIHTRAALDGLEGRSCFAAVHVELDVAESYYALGHDAAAARAADPARRTRGPSRRRSGRATAPSATSSARQRRASGAGAVVFVRRASTRRLTNFDALAGRARARADAAGLDFVAVALEELPFDEQRALFARCAVLVAQYGSALHNVIFLPPGAAVVLLPMPKWCGEAWHFERQAALSGASSVTVCAGAGADDGARFRWAHRAWLQGPWATKDADFAVDADRFDAGVAAALGAVGGPPASATVAADDENVHRCPTRTALATPRVHVDALDAAACFRASAFNEFSTLDVTVPWGERLAVAVWLRGAGGAAADVDLRRRLLQQGLPAVRTHVTLDVDGAYGGLGVSTVTHKQAPAPHRAPPPAAAAGAGTFEVRDWRLFAETCDVLEVPVQIDGRPVRLPTARRPFLFLHHEKTAGSSLRRHVVDAARARGLAFYVPCYDAAGTYWEDYRCYAFDVANASAANGGPNAELAVLAGHFEWGVWDDLESYDAAAPPPCFTMVRHPVDRAVSLYYERVYQRDDIGGARVNDLPLGEFEWLLRAFKGSAFSRYRDEGFCDAMCKNTLGLSLHRGRLPEDVDARRAAEPALFAAYEADLDAGLAVDRLRHCVVGLQDDWAGSKRSLAHWFPWIASIDDARRNAGLGAAAETRDTLRPDLRAALEACDACDLALYDAAAERHAAQLRYLDGLGS